MTANEPASQFLLAFDVGNSRIKFSLFDRDEQAAHSGLLPRCLHTGAVSLDESVPWDEILGWRASLASRLVSGIVAGANPAGIDQVLNTWPADTWQCPRLAEDPAHFPLEIRVAAPHKVGIDRLLNVVAANVVRPVDCPAVIVDSGTATTVDFVAPDGAFAGGAILPGFELSARSLHHYTALLPLISIEELSGKSPDPLGTNTREALSSGLFWSQLGAVKELILRFGDLSNKPAFVLLTGGGASLLAPHLPNVRWESHLSLQGLALVADHV